MKKLIILLILAISLGAGMIGAMPGLSQAQVAPPPAPVVAPPPAPVVGPPPVPVPAPYATEAPWVGPGTPWVYYNGDWFLNGILYYFFGSYGWGPYYVYPETYIVRPGHWYGPRWKRWYRAHPTYLGNFQHGFPIWRGHQVGRRYGEEFYNKNHPGQGGGWHHGGAGHGHGPGRP
ncbi:MAG: hypothetical protein ABSA09_03540 [Desulfobaccales bacterium]|jgi:hypothetical protein